MLIKIFCRNFKFSIDRMKTRLYNNRYRDTEKHELLGGMRMTYSDLRKILTSVENQNMSVKELRAVLFEIENRNDMNGVSNEIDELVLMKETR